MANITTYLENRLLSQSIGVSPTSWPSATYAGLFIVAPTTDYTQALPTGSEVAKDRGYMRKTVSWGSATAGSISNSSDITWTGTGAWNVSTNASSAAPITYVGIFDNADSNGTKTGNLLWFGALSAAVTISQNGDSFTISSGNLVLTLS